MGTSRGLGFQRPHIAMAIRMAVMQAMLAIRLLPPPHGMAMLMQPHVAACTLVAWWEARFAYCCDWTMIRRVARA